MTESLEQLGEKIAMEHVMSANLETTIYVTQDQMDILIDENGFRAILANLQSYDKPRMKQYKTKVGVLINIKLI